MKRLLLVEDDSRWVQVFERLTDDLEVEVRSVAMSAQAIEVLDDWLPDLIVVDILLAGETGIALLNEIRSHGDLAAIPVIVCSGLQIGEDDLAGYGIVRLFDKSTVTPEQIRRAIVGVLS